MTEITTALSAIPAVARAAQACADRRAAVLRHSDLAARLTKPPLNYERPEQWNGWIPPAVINPGGSDALASPHGRFNQLGRRTRGSHANDSPRRAALVAICAEAWQRETANGART